MKKMLVVVGLIALLSGCSSAPEVETHSYLLNPPPSHITQRAYKGDEPLILVAPVSMSGLLTGNGIVYQTSNNTIVVAQHHLWADALSQQLHQRIVAVLRSSTLPFWPISGTSSLEEPTAFTLTLHFDKFNGSYTGNALISGEWQLLDNQGDLLKAEAFNIEEALENDGYHALVEALSIAVDRLNKELVGKLFLAQ